MELGDRVKCIKPIKGLVMNREYIVQAKHVCCCFKISVGLPLKQLNANRITQLECPRCSTIISSTTDKGEDFYYTSRFVKVEEKTKYKVVRIAIEIEEPVLN